MPALASVDLATSQAVLSNLVLPIGSNCTEHRPGRNDRHRRARLRLRQRRIGRRGQRPEQREISRRRKRAAGHDDRLAPDLVGQPAEQDEEGRRQRQRDGDQDVGGRAVDLERLLEKEQRVELPGVPDHRLPRDRADQGDQHQPRVAPAPERLGQRRLRPLARRLHLAEHRRFLELHADVERDAEQQDRDQERDPPAPVGERFLAEPGADSDHHQQRREQAQRRGGLDEAGVQPALPLGRMLGDIGRGPAIFAAEREALEQPQRHQRDRRDHPREA